MHYIYVASLSDCICNISNDIFDVVSRSSREYIYRKKQIKDRYRTVIAEVLLKMIFIDKLNLCKTYFYRTKRGVLFSRNCENHFFSISHSENYIIVIVSVFEVGIDIQYMNSNMLKIAKRFFYPGEIDYIYEFEKEIKNRFYEIWTKKESYYKYIGHKLYKSILEIDTTCDKMNFNKNIVKEYKTIIFKNDYMLTVCSSEVINNLKDEICFIKSFEINEFIKKIRK